MVRGVYVAYGDISKVPLAASAKPLDALLQTGFDLYVEVASKRWTRAVDLPENHPAMLQLKTGGFKAGLTDSQGQVFTVLNAYNPEHRQIAAQNGLIINSPYHEQKVKELVESLQRVLDFLKLEVLAVKVKGLEKVLNEIISRASKIEEFEGEKKQSEWDGIINRTLTMADALEIILRVSSLEPTQMSRMELAEAIKQAKKEAAVETALEESILLNPELIRNLRKTLLED